jgi:hypothetical protein
MAEAADMNRLRSCRGERAAQRRPAPHGAHQRRGLAAPLGQVVDLDAGGRRQPVAQDDAGLLEALQALGQHVGAEAREVRPDLAEAARAEHELAHDQQRPALADEFEGQGGAAGIVIAALPRARSDVSYFF